MKKKQWRALLLSYMPGLHRAILSVVGSDWSSQQVIEDRLNGLFAGNAADDLCRRGLLEHDASGKEYRLTKRGAQVTAVLVEGQARP